MRLEHVETEEDMLVARLISNVCRRHVPAEEKTEMLGKLGETYLSEGLKPGKIAHKIAEETGMSYRWVMTYLPGKLKERPGLGGPSEALEFDKRKEKRQKSKVASLATGDVKLLFSDPQEKILTTRNYANTGFVNVVLEKRFYMRVEKIAEKLGAHPDTIINNTLRDCMVKLEYLELDKIRVEAGVRKTPGEEQSFEELTDSIAKHGVLQPVLVEPTGEEGSYRLLIGDRRLKAAGKAGLKTVPAVILDEALKPEEGLREASG